MASVCASLGCLRVVNRRLLNSQWRLKSLQWHARGSLPYLACRNLHSYKRKPEILEQPEQPSSIDDARSAGEFQEELESLNDHRKKAEDFKKYFHFPKQSGWSEFQKDRSVTVNGFLSSRRVQSSKLVFANVSVQGGPAIQLEAKVDGEDGRGTEALEALRAVPLHSPVSVTGRVLNLSGKSPSDRFDFSRVDLELTNIQELNLWPKDIIISAGVQFPPEARHLQIRFNEKLQNRLLFRHSVNTRLRQSLEDLGLQEYETPILFKSTPEGAREFLVPTRRKGKFYALPQSPQQYKQILMASGVRGYYQFARCFRDEDLRADRQPEFTQLDMEMSFATGEDVMRTVETLVSDLPAWMNAKFGLLPEDGKVSPISRDKLRKEDVGKVKPWEQFHVPFKRITYQEAMTRYGVDKPDTRIPFEIKRVEHILPSNFVSMITHLENPVVEAFCLKPDRSLWFGVAADSADIFRRFMEVLPKEMAKSESGAPVMIVVDSSKPLMGLSSLGHEGFASLTSGDSGLEDFQDLEDGDVLFFHARPNEPFRGGSTVLGNLRNLVYAEAIQKKLQKLDRGWNFLWVTEFPMFTPDSGEDGDPGQGGTRGFSATHHPFTAPLTEEDFDLMMTDPLAAKADHYDLVLNGVELGGGSRRIHVAEVQRYVFREILGMDEHRMSEFSHLLEALSAGCPPHAGFALGFDRLVAMLSGTDSVRDVIAFPKTMKGMDVMVKSPSIPDEEYLALYGIQLWKPKSKQNPRGGK